MKKVIFAIIGLVIIYSIVQVAGGLLDKRGGTVSCAVVTAHMECSSWASPDKYQEEVRETVESGGRLTVVEPTGAPLMRYSKDQEVESNVFLSNSKRESLKKKAFEEAKSEIEGSIATHEESDPLKAIHIAATELAEVKGEKHIIVACNMIPTTGIANFTNAGLIAMKPKEAAKVIGRASAIPDLSGIHVKVLISPSQPPQKELSYERQEWLLHFWREILSLANAASIDVDRVNGEANDTDVQLPCVTPADLGEDSLDLSMIFTEEEIGFKAGSVELRDVAKSESQLEKVKHYMASHPAEKLIIGASTASVPEKEEACVTLSYARAQRIKELLVEMGCDGEKLDTVGLGFRNDPFHVEDLNEYGKLIEENAKLNRKVVICSASSKNGKLLLKRKEEIR